MYLNFCCIVRQWLCNVLNKPTDENSLRHQSFAVILWNLKTKQLRAHNPPTPPPPPQVGPTKTLPSIGSPKITSTSCKVIDISPCGRWNVWVSGHYRSTRADIRPWSVSLDGALYNPSSPTNLIISITRLSSIDIFAISLERPRQSSGLKSCKIDKN